jgi:hypothetical protein
MKKLILIAMMLAPLGLAAKKTTFDNIAAKYEGVEDYTIVTLSAEQLIQAKALDEKLSVALKDVKSFRVLTTGEEDPALLAEIESLISQKRYEAVLSVASDDTTIVRMVASKSKNKKRGGYKEMLIYVNGDSNVVLIQILGDLNVAEIMKNTTIDVDKPFSLNIGN